jgi:hypothetical protein
MRSNPEHKRTLSILHSLSRGEYIHLSNGRTIAMDGDMTVGYIDGELRLYTRMDLCELNGVLNEVEVATND